MPKAPVGKTTKPEVIAPVKTFKPEVIPPVKPVAATPPTTGSPTPFGQSKATAADIAIANPTVKNINTYIDSLKTKLADMNVAAGLNPDGSAKAEKPLTRVEQNAATKAAGPPGQAPAGFVYKFISDTAGGSWRLYSTGTPGGGTGGTGTGTGTGTGANTTDTPGKPSTSVDVLKALLKAQGFSSTIVDSSATYLNSLLKDNLDYENAIEVFLNTKDYTLKNGTKITSPFYTEYGYLNEGLPMPKTAGEIFNAVEGYKGLKSKYGFSDKYLAVDSIKEYVKNNVSVEDLDRRANEARLAGITADPNKTAAFIKLGYIKDATGLQDFFMDSKLGKEQFETNRNTGAFVAEAIRRGNVQTGAAPLADFKKIAADLTAKGYTEAAIAQLASTGFENIAQTINPLVKYAGIYQKSGGTVESNQALTESLQQSLVAEEFQGTASERRKILEEQNKRAFQGTAGLTSGSLTSKMV
jgi:hypothetical protein